MKPFCHQCTVQPMVLIFFSPLWRRKKVTGSANCILGQTPLAIAGGWARLAK
ncbi:hypothetical protein D082_34690 [Synechocystis sp. PCC 6714]|nr:hypothetical protein D082_34690 [Synechocystis sp. PCC 6714]